MVLPTISALHRTHQPACSNMVHNKLPHYARQGEQLLLRDILKKGLHSQQQSYAAYPREGLQYRQASMWEGSQLHNMIG